MVRVILGLFFLMMAVALAGADGIRWLQSGIVQFRSLGEVWYALDSSSLNLAQALVQRYLSPSLWDPWITQVLLFPAWLIPSLLGVFLLVMASRRRRKAPPVFGRMVK